MNFSDRIVDIATRPIPLRTLFFRKLFRHWPLGSYRARLYGGAVDRREYGWCTYHAAAEAKALGLTAMTVVEMGVAGGNGLVSLLDHKAEIEKIFGIEIVVAGFDMGSGLPPSTDPRDLLYYWPAGSFEMDRDALEKRIQGRAELILGDIRTTITEWEPRPDAPVGAVLFDMDVYTSTLAALQVLTKSNALPRVWCYFDDICGYPETACSSNIGEREAVRQFNLDPERSIRNDHLSPAYTFKTLVTENWHEHIYLYHRLCHPDYNRCLSKLEKHQLPLNTA